MKFYTIITLIETYYARIMELAQSSGNLSFFIQSYADNDNIISLIPKLKPIPNVTCPLKSGECATLKT